MGSDQPEYDRASWLGPGELNKRKFTMRAFDVKKEEPMMTGYNPTIHLYVETHKSRVEIVIGSKFWHVLLSKMRKAAGRRRPRRHS
jgi:hypothetical protein